MSAPILSLDRVSYAYPDSPLAVEDLRFSLEKGERVAVLGRNGAGRVPFSCCAAAFSHPSRALFPSRAGC